MNWDWFDERPLLMAIAGSNGAGKTTFFHAHVEPAGLRFVNADCLAATLDIDVYLAARIAQDIRHELVDQGESFVFETVLSDPVGEKVRFLADAVGRGYTVVLCFIWIESADQSEERVAMRVTQGGHDVPSGKLRSRYPRTIMNLNIAIQSLPHVLLFDNSDLAKPFRHVAHTLEGRLQILVDPVPNWLDDLTS